MASNPLSNGAPVAVMAEPTSNSVLSNSHIDANVPGAEARSQSPSQGWDMDNVKSAPDDSEAETEILSVTHTPLKMRRFGHEDPLEPIRETGAGKVEGDSIEALSDGKSPPVAEGLQVVRTRRKRKIALGGGSEGHISFANGKHETRSGPLSSWKRSRLSPAAAAGRDASANVNANDNAKSTRSASRGSHGVKEEQRGAGDETALPHPKRNRAASTSTSPDPFTLTSKRATTQEPRTRSRSRSPSHSPSLTHRLHKRSSSFHSPFTPADRERRLRRRRDPHQDILAISLNDLASPSGHRSTSSDQLNLSTQAHMARIDKTGRTELAKACDKGDDFTVKSILDQSHDDINTPDNAWNRPIQFAALHGSVEIVKMLIDARCNVNVVNEAGDTPLIDAVENGHVEVVEMLLSAGAHIDCRNKKGKYPRDLIPENEDEMKKLLDDAWTKYENSDRQEADTVKQDSTATSVPGQDKSSKRSDLHFLDFNIQRLEEKAGQGDLVAVDYIMSGGIKANNNCVVAAAVGGHKNVLDSLLTYGKAQLDPDPATIKGETPMLAAIGRGNIEVIEYMLNYGNFDAKRPVLGGRHYFQISRERKGPRWQEECRLLREAFDKVGKVEAVVERTSSPEENEPPRRRRLVSGRQVAEEAARQAAGRMILTPVPVSARGSLARDFTAMPPSPTPGTTPPIGSKEPSSLAGTPAPSTAGQGPDGDPVIATGSPSSPAVEAAPAGPSPESLLAASRLQAEQEREKYLDMMPRGLRGALTPEGKIRTSIFPPKTPEIAYLKDLYDWMPIPFISRAFFDPDINSTPHLANQIYMPNFFAAVFLRHNRLDSCKTDLGWATLPLLKRFRANLWKRFGLQSVLIMGDCEWLRAPRELQDASGIEMERYISSTTGRELTTIHWKKTVEEGFLKWLNLPDDQVFWVKVEDFMKAAKPALAPHLRNVEILTINNALNLQTPRVKNGTFDDTPRPHPANVIALERYIKVHGQPDAAKPSGSAGPSASGTAGTGATKTAGTTPTATAGSTPTATAGSSAMTAVVPAAVIAAGPATSTGVNPATSTAAAPAPTTAAGPSAGGAGTGVPHGATAQSRPAGAALFEGARNAAHAAIAHQAKCLAAFATPVQGVPSAGPGQSVPIDITAIDMSAAAIQVPSRSAAASPGSATHAPSGNTTAGTSRNATAVSSPSATTGPSGNVAAGKPDSTAASPSGSGDVGSSGQGGTTSPFPFTFTAGGSGLAGATGPVISTTSGASRGGAGGASRGGGASGIGGVSHGRVGGGAGTGSGGASPAGAGSGAGVEPAGGAGGETGGVTGGPSESA